MEASLTAYDVEKNSDLFYRDVPDGVRCLTFGALPRAPQPLAFVGGHCSIQVRPNDWGFGRVWRWLVHLA